MPTLTWFPRASQWDQARGMEISWLLPFPFSLTPTPIGTTCISQIIVKSLP